MTGAVSRIGKLTARDGNELPVIAARVQTQFENSKSFVAPDFSGGQRPIKSALILATCSNHELSYAFLRVGHTVWSLGRKTFVVVIVAVQDDVGASFIEVIPKRFHRKVIAVLVS